MRIGLLAGAAVLALTAPASAADTLPACRHHNPPDTGSCVFDARHATGPYADWYSVSYRLWADGTQVYITHRRAHRLLYGAGS